MHDPDRDALAEEVVLSMHNISYFIRNQNRAFFERSPGSRYHRIDR